MFELILIILLIISFVMTLINLHDLKQLKEENINAKRSLREIKFILRNAELTKELYCSTIEKIKKVIYQTAKSE